MKNRGKGDWDGKVVPDVTGGHVPSIDHLIWPYFAAPLTLAGAMRLHK